MSACFTRIICICFVLYVNSSFAQKPIIDTSVFGKWPSFWDASVAVSNDGKYVTYIIGNQPIKNHTLVIQSIDSKLKMEIINGSNPYFTSDSKYVLYKIPHDSLVIASLEIRSQEYIPNVASFKLFQAGTDQWLSHLTNGSNRSLKVRNLTTNQRYQFKSVSDYHISEKGRNFLLQKKLDDQNKFVLELVNLKDGTNSKVYEGYHANNFIFNDKEDKVAFVIEDSSEKKAVVNKILLYNIEDKNTSVVLGDKACVFNGSRLAELTRFSHNGERIFFKIMPSNLNLKPNVKLTRVDVWNYKDSHLQSQQLENRNSTSLYTCVLNLTSGKLVQVENEFSKVLNSAEAGSKSDEYLLVIDGQMGDLFNEWNWNENALVNVSLVSTSTGSITRLAEKQNILTANTYKISPYGKYIIYYDPILKNYFTYLIESRVRKNITEKAKTKWTTYYLSDMPFAPFITINRGVAGWLRNDSCVLIYDEKDIFQADPSGKLPPVNLTNGFGRKNNIVFSMALKENEGRIIQSDSIILSAFNLSNKDEGFYRVILNKERPFFNEISMQPYMFKGSYDGGRIAVPWLFKAKRANVYVVTRMSEQDAPNCYVTTDFMNFKPLSSIYPEKKYNWITSELISYKMVNGLINRGVLFKPSNFDPIKRYPLIIHYYEKLSDRLHKYLDVGASDGPINIPYFVSHGYLIFTPDIAYSIGSPGKSAFNSVVAAAKYLSKFSYIDSTKMAIQGQSFGGYETNYIATHTKMFAAAMSSSGVSNFISGYGSVLGEGEGSHFFYELSQSRIGATLWERPELYISNSPVFQANKITTPILMMNNKADPKVSFSQGVEFFTALRRLGKKAWMLQYDGGDHMVDGDDAVDLTIRMQQFFDHYLKEVPAPVWMSQGIPAKLKQIVTGYDLDPANSCGRDCKVCKMWNEKWKKDSAATMIEIRDIIRTEH